MPTPIIGAGKHSESNGYSMLGDKARGVHVVHKGFGSAAVIIQ